MMMMINYQILVSARLWPRDQNPLESSTAVSTAYLLYTLAYKSQNL